MESNAIEIISKNIKTMAKGAEFSDFFKFLIQLTLLILLCFIIYYLINIGNQYVEVKKKVNIDKKQIYKFIFIFLNFLLIIFIFKIRGLLFEILEPFIFAIALSYILNPMVKYLYKKGIERFWGVLIIYLTIFIALLVISLTLIPKFTEEVKKFIEIMPKYSNDAYDFIYTICLKYNHNIESLPAELDGLKNLLRLNLNKIEGLVLDIITSATNILLNIFSKIIALILVPILTFYFLKDTEKFKRSILLTIPKFCRSSIICIAKDIDKVLGGFIRGQLIVATLIGILTTVSLLILKVQFALLVGVIAGITNIIPYFGPVVGIIPGVLFALMDGPAKAIWVIVIFTIIQQIESALISPKIVGESVGIHPVLVILALIVGGKFFGIIGLLVSIPIVAIIKVIGIHIISYIAKL